MLPPGDTTRHEPARPARPQLFRAATLTWQPATPDPGAAQVPHRTRPRPLTAVCPGRFSSSRGRNRRPRPLALPLPGGASPPLPCVEGDVRGGRHIGQRSGRGGVPRHTKENTPRTERERPGGRRKLTCGAGG
jgi:hypothetical protein